MTDFDADESVSPQKPRGRFPLLSSDRFLAWSGAVLAVTAAFFPWYVFFNEEKFSLNYANLISGEEVSDWTGKPLVRPKPSAVGEPSKEAAASMPIDDLTTGTVPKEKKVEGTQGEDEEQAQPFPAAPVEFRLLHVSNGKAMIAADSDLYVVQVGSVLPDLSKVATFEERAGQWVIITDKGEIYDAKGKRK